MSENFENKIVEVCSECEQASCWYGEFMCCESSNAGTVKRTVAQLRVHNREHEQYWSADKMTKIYGEPAPFGYSQTDLDWIAFMRHYHLAP